MKLNLVLAGCAPCQGPLEVVSRELLNLHLLQFLKLPCRGAPEVGRRVLSGLREVGAGALRPAPLG